MKWLSSLFAITDLDVWWPLTASWWWCTCMVWVRKRTIRNWGQTVFLVLARLCKDGGIPSNSLQENVFALICLVSCLDEFWKKLVVSGAQKVPGASGWQTCSLNGVSEGTVCDFLCHACRNQKTYTGNRSQCEARYVCVPVDLSHSKAGMSGVVGVVDGMSFKNKWFFHVISMPAISIPAMRHSNVEHVRVLIGLHTCM